MPLFPVKPFSDLALQLIETQAVRVRLTQQVLSAPVVVARDVMDFAAWGFNSPVPATDPVIMMDSDAMAAMIAEGEGMFAGKAMKTPAARQPAKKTEYSAVPYDAPCNRDAAPVDHPVPEKRPEIRPEIRKAWSYTRPPVREQDLLIERRVLSPSRLAYTPQGQAPDSPSAIKVLERHKARTSSGAPSL